MLTLSREGWLGFHYLHVGGHVLSRAIRRNKDNLDSLSFLTNIFDFYFHEKPRYLVEVLKHRGELPAGRTPVSREVVEDQILVTQKNILHLNAKEGTKS